MAIVASSQRGQRKGMHVCVCCCALGCVCNAGERRGEGWGGGVCVPRQGGNQRPSTMQPQQRCSRHHQAVVWHVHQSKRPTGATVQSNDTKKLSYETNKLRYAGKPNAPQCYYNMRIARINLPLPESTRPLWPRHHPQAFVP